MPPPVILDPSSLDLTRCVFAREAIEELIPQRHEFALLDAVVYIDPTERVFAGYHDVRPDGWWARGHIPGRPLFPGVLMMEVAAQLASFMTSHLLNSKGFVGFAGIDDVKFRGAVVPPCRFVVIGRALTLRPRRTVCAAQGFIDTTMVFEAEITGMLM